LSLACLSRLVKCLWVITGVYLRVEHLKGAPLMQALAFNCKHYTMLERLPRDEHSSLLQNFVNCGQKRFYNIGPSLIFAGRDRSGALYGAQLRQVLRLACKYLIRLEVIYNDKRSSLVVKSFVIEANRFSSFCSIFSFSLAFMSLTKLEIYYFIVYSSIFIYE
jgi:hypothetical protein